MTHRQLTWLGVASVIVTAFVLIVGLSPPGISAAAKAALGRSSAPTPQTVAAATADTDADDADSASTAEDAIDDEAAGSSAKSSTALDAADVADESATDADTADDDDSDDSADSSDPPETNTAASDKPAATNVKHVFVITLAGQGFDAAFGSSSQAPYLAQELRPKGTLLTGFTSLGKAGLPDRLAFVGGQPPNPSTEGECTTYKEIPPLTQPSKTGVIAADGCVYPNSIVSLGDQLTSNRLSWQAYAEDHEKGPGGPATLCRRPVSDEVDTTQTPRPGDAYAARNNPFVYFHSLLDLSGCDADSGPLTTLDGDLADPEKTPNFSYIAPNLCHDGSQLTCGDGEPAGLPAADAFLKTVVPKILASKGYQDNGLLMITFAGGPGDTPTRNGTLLLSRFAQAGGSDDTAFDPYSLLRSTEDLLGIRPLAKAADAKSFAGTVLASARVTVAGDD